MNKNILKIVLINLLIFAFLIYIADFVVFFTRCYTYSEHNQTKKIDYSKKIYPQFCAREYHCKFNSYPKYFVYEDYRDYKKEQKNTKSPILLFGCSFMYGDNIKYEDSFSYVLGLLSNRNVYNRAASGSGVREILLKAQIISILQEYEKEQKQNNNISFDNVINKMNFDKESKKNFKIIFNNKNLIDKILKDYKEIALLKNINYIFYIYINDHTRRMYHSLFEPTESTIRIQYKYINNKFILKNILKERYRFPSMMDFIEEYQINNNLNTEKDNTLLALYLKEAKNLLKKNNPNLKFVIINYPIRNQQEKIELEKYYDNDKDFIVINIEDFINDDIQSPKYWAIDDLHPSEIVWKEAMPNLIKKFNL